MVDTQVYEQIASVMAGKLPQISKIDLELLCKEYPCFSSAYLLQAIVDKQEKEEVFQANLPSTATRVNNRSVLYDRVHTNFNQATSIPELKEKVLLPSEEGDKEVEELLLNAISLKEEEPLKVEVPVVENVPSIEEKFEKEETPAIFEANINLTDLAASINKKAKKVKKKEVPERKKAVPKEKIVKQEKKKVVSKKATPKESKPKSFTDWLKNKKAVKKKEIEVQEKQVQEEEIPLDLAVSNEAELIMEAKKSPLKLEEFIVNQIEIKQNRKAHLASDFTHAVSETYAEILSAQGKKLEAIVIYKELSIKYPEKSSNFARQIEKLKNSI